MTALRRFALAALAALALFLLLSWPLPRFAARAIPYTAFERNPGQPPTVMVPGDHLQFLYHMWLAQDTFFGPTPFFRNLYEFNAGDDDARREPSTYYLPFSLLFSAASLPFGRAAGWNFAVFASLLLAVLASWALARRFVASERLAFLLALVPAAFPFTWVNILSGSPTGFAMLWVPLLFLGIDLWLADSSPWGAALAGASVFFSEWTDTHVFFFSVLVFPFWALFCHARRRGLRFARADVLAILRSAWPLLLFAALAALKAWGVSRGLQGSAASGGRSIGEVSALSCPLSTLFSSGGVSKIYVGPFILALYALLALLAVLRLLRAPRSPAAWTALALVLALAALAFLSAGTCNPFGPRAWTLLCRLVPPYAMIRQADKVFCLLPALFMVLLALSLPSRRPALFLEVAVLGVALSSFFRFTPGLTFLHDDQPAYRAVAEDAASRGFDPRAVVIPLWPGNSHMSSIYQFDGSLYRIRLLNGYRPTAQNDYLASVFRPLDSLNLGYPSPSQLALLAEDRIDYLIFDENSFPEKVSSFPPAFTLCNLLAHPRLRFLAHDGAIWSFRILPESDPASTPSPPQSLNPSPPPLLNHSITPPPLFPVRTWNWKNSPDLPPGAEALPEPAASSDRVLHIPAPMDHSISSRWIRVAGPGPWTWLARVRGAASVRWTLRRGREDFASDSIAPDPAFDADSISSFATRDDWIWLSIPVPPAPDDAPDLLTIDLALLSGSADVDAVLLTRDPCPFAAPLSAPLRIPATAFFRAGFADPASGAVRFDPAATPSGEMLYSRNLPLPVGRYRLSIDLEAPADAPPRVPLGALRFYPDPDSPALETPVLPGRPAALEISVASSRFPRIAFDYARTSPLVVHALTLEPLP